MTEPKFKLGEKVFFFRDYLPQEERVSATARLVDRSGNHEGYQYHFGSECFASDLESDGWVWEGRVFASKQELLDSL